jgi:prophage regulatory protein
VSLCLTTDVSLSEAITMRVLSYPDLKGKGIRFSRQWITRLIAAGKFPRSISLGKQSVGFIESEIDAWINDRIRERDQKRAAGAGSEIERPVARIDCNHSKLQR